MKHDYFTYSLFHKWIKIKVNQKCIKASPKSTTLLSEIEISELQQ